MSRSDPQWKTAFERADGVWRKATDAPSREVVLYESLTQKDFTALAEQFGPEAIMQYVQEMETQKLKGNSHA